MDKVNVLVLGRLRLHPGYLEEIRAVDPRLSVKDGTDSFVAELHRSGKKGRIVNSFINDAAIGHDSQPAETLEDLDTLLSQAEVIFGVLLFPENLLARAPRLKWIHIGGTGIDLYISSGIFDGKATVTNSRGVMAISIAEHVMAFIFMLAKNAPRLLDNKYNRRWDAFGTMELRNRTVGIIGLGAIGSEVARMAKGIGMKVLATRRSATKRESGVFGVDELYPLQDLHQMLSECDFVVIAAPLIAETKGMIGEAELRVMKPSAYLINIARGPIVDQAALIRALREGWIAGAGLDVFDTEPLPEDSELWELPNAILSYHMAAFGDTHSHRVVGLFCENLKKYLAGEQLPNVIDMQKKY